MKSLLLLFILLNILANGEEQAFDGQAEIALEKALEYVIRLLIRI
jgi:hypothetical protein